MNNLTIESKQPINFFINGSKPVLSIVEAVLKPVTTSGYGDSLSSNYEYYGYVEGARVKIASGPFSLDEATMNAVYASIEAGIPAGATFSGKNLYLYSTILISEATTKFVGINPGLTANDFQIKV